MCMFWVLLERERLYFESGADDSAGCHVGTAMQRSLGLIGDLPTSIPNLVHFQ